MYVDVTELLEVRQEVVGAETEVHMTNPLVLGALLRRHVLATTQCTATCGFGTNRLLARLATKRAKPNSQGLFLDAEWHWLSPSAKENIWELAGPEGRKYLEDLLLAQLPGMTLNRLPI